MHVPFCWNYWESNYQTDFKANKMTSGEVENLFEYTNCSITPVFLIIEIITKIRQLSGS